MCKKEFNNVFLLPPRRSRESFHFFRILNIEKIIFNSRKFVNDRSRVLGHERVAITEYMRKAQEKEIFVFIAPEDSINREEKYLLL